MPDDIVYYQQITICNMHIVAGRGLKMNEQGFVPCHHSKHKTGRYLEVSLLILLYHTSGYGYKLKDGLRRFGFQSDDLNLGSLYKGLRKMEKKGSVSSHWQKGKKGPKRRIYEITQEGKEELDEWMTFLKGRKRKIERLIDQYEKTVGEDRVDHEQDTNRQT